MLAVGRKKRRESAGLAALEILLGKAHARTDTHRLAGSRWVVPPRWPRPRVGTSDCRFGPMGGGRSPPLRARGALREWGIPLRDIIDSEWWRCSTVRKVHRRARATRAVRTRGNVRALHRTGKKDRPVGIRVSASDGDEPRRGDDMPLAVSPVSLRIFLIISFSLSPPSPYFLLDVFLD